MKTLIAHRKVSLHLMRKRRETEESIIKSLVSSKIPATRSSCKIKVALNMATQNLTSIQPCNALQLEKVPYKLLAPWVHLFPHN